MQHINPMTSPNELNTTLTPHSIILGDACFAYFNKIWGIPETEAAERYIPGVYKGVPERFFSYPYGGSYLRKAKRSFGNPYVNPYYGSYYAPQYHYGYWNYHSPYYW